MAETKMGGRTRRLGHRPLRGGGQPGVPLPREAARPTKPSERLRFGWLYPRRRLDIEMVQEVVRAIREAGARTDSSCGIHVHVGFGQHTPASLRRLVNIVNAKEDLLTMALGISQHRREEWCRPVDQRFLEALNRAKPDTLGSFAAIWYRHNSEAGYYWEMLARHHYDHSR